MKMFVGIVMTLFICMTFRGYTQQTATTPENIKFVVLVSIQCDDENTKQWIISYINRELRSLGDVSLPDEITPNEAKNMENMAKYGKVRFYGLTLIAIEMINKAKIKLGGIAISAVHLEPVFSLLHPIFADTISPEMRQSIKSHIADRYNVNKKVHLNLDRYHNSALHIGGKDNLSSICRDIVTEFDINTLQPVREGLNQ